MKAKLVNLDFERGLEPKKSMDVGINRKFKIGDKVALPPNKEEGWKYEEGIIMEIEPGHPQIAQVEIDKKFRKKGDDGYREVDIDDQFIKHI